MAHLIESASRETRVGFTGHPHRLNANSPHYRIPTASPQGPRVTAAPLTQTDSYTGVRHNCQIAPSRSAGQPLARKLLNDPLVEQWFSAASIWEALIKSSLGRRDCAVDPMQLRRGLLRHGYAELPITGQHALASADLPAMHPDPFDRMLLAQARSEAEVHVKSALRSGRWPRWAWPTRASVQVFGASHSPSAEDAGFRGSLRHFERAEGCTTARVEALEAWAQAKEVYTSPHVRPSTIATPPSSASLRRRSPHPAPASNLVPATPREESHACEVGNRSGGWAGAGGASHDRLLVNGIHHGSGHSFGRCS